MSGLVIVTAPPDEPVTLEEATLFARWESGTDEDALFNSLIQSSREQVEIVTEHQLNTATYRQYFDGWPASRCFLLDKPPLQSVTSIQYIDSDDNTQTVTASDYIVYTENQHRGIVQFKNNYSLPVLREERFNSVIIEFVCGYQGWPVGNAQDVPQSLKDAIKIFVNDAWSHREFDLDGNITGTIQDNSVAMQKLGSYRVHTPTAIGFASNVSNVIR
jgi:uncharacterized phiE125 gp8 family phage protein